MILPSLIFPFQDSEDRRRMPPQNNQATSRPYGAQNPNNISGNKQKAQYSSQTPTPPPLPESLPPDQVGNQAASLIQSQVQSGAARLDLLVGGVGTGSYENDTNENIEHKEVPTPKRVSFNTVSQDREDNNKASTSTNGIYDDSSNESNNDDKLYRLERAEEKGPNVSRNHSTKSIITY